MLGEINFLYVNTKTTPQSSTPPKLNTDPRIRHTANAKGKLYFSLLIVLLRT